MAILRCENGHFYDNEKFVTCPHCGVKIPQGLKSSNLIQDQKTVKIETEDMAGNLNIDLYYDPEDDGNTSNVVSVCKAVDKGYPVGWLVCIKGPDYSMTRKCSFLLKSGFNWISRLYKRNGVFSFDWKCELDDIKVSRDKHCAVVYEPVKKQFFLVPGAGNLVYMNDVMVNGACELKNGDQFQVGDSVLELVVFCREGHSWEDFE